MDVFTSFYAIYHIRSGTYMPLMPNGRGVTHVGPNEWSLYARTPPRLFRSFVGARNALVAYCRGKFAARWDSCGDRQVDVIPQPDRKREDFLIHELRLDIHSVMDYKGYLK